MAHGQRVIERIEAVFTGLDIVVTVYTHPDQYRYGFVWRESLPT